MKIISTNIAKPTTIIWNNTETTTGIYKTPIKEPIYLGKNDVKGDEVSDRNVHGGEFKACYLFSENHYEYWKALYPNLDWDYGMFGENLTVSNLDECKLLIGNIYNVGEATVQITIPREPCFKLGVKFGNQQILKEFIDYGLPGTYVRILKEGNVKIGDSFILTDQVPNSLSIAEFFKLLYSSEKDKSLLKKIVKNEAIPLKKRKKVVSFLRK